MPILYPATCARYHLLAGCSRQIANPKRSRVVDGRWCKSTPGKCTHSEVLGRIELDSSSLRRTILDMFRKEVGDRGRGKTCFLVLIDRSRLSSELVSIFVDSQHVAVVGECRFRFPCCIGNGISFPFQEVLVSLSSSSVF